MKRKKKPDFSGWTTIENLPTADLRELPAGEPDTYHPQFFRVYNLFALVTYKPGTRIVVEAEKHRVCVNVWIPTVNSNNMEEYYEGRFYLWAGYDLLEQQTDKELIAWLFNNVTAFETHEAMEFFKLGGKHVANPHPWWTPRGEYMRSHARTWDLKPKEINGV